MTPPTGDPRQQLGRAGEAAAEAELLSAGFEVLERRFRLRIGEVDLIARRDELVVFVEVKTRSGFGYGGPAGAVTPRKQRRLARVALAWLSGRGWLERPCRFDVIEVFFRDGRVLRLRHIEDAFRPAPGRG